MASERSEQSETVRIMADQLIGAAMTTLYRLAVLAILVFLLLPLVIIPVISVGTDPYAGGIPSEFTLEWYTSVSQTLTDFNFFSAVVSSSLLALTTALLSTLMGGLAAFAVVRYDFRFSTTLQTILISPLVFPWLVIGLGILLLISQMQSTLGLVFESTFWTLLLGHIAFSVPYAIRTIGASLENYNRSLDHAARDLGASEFKMFRKITLPLLKPGIISSMIIIFILSFNMYIISLFLKGADIELVPILMFNLFRIIPPAQIAALATLLMAAQVLLILLAEVFFGISDYL